MKHFCYGLIALVLFASCKRRLDYHHTNIDKLAEIEIIPGESIGELYLGEDVDDVLQTMGKPYEKRYWHSIVESYTEYGYDISKELEFEIKFDYSLEYDGSSNNSDIPVFRLNFKDDKLVFMVISIKLYGLDSSNCLINGKEAFCSLDEVLATYGEGKHIAMEDYDGEYQYRDKGISFISEKGKVCSIFLFRKL